MPEPLHLSLIGYNVVLHKPNGDVALTGSIGIVSPQEKANAYELFTENGTMYVEITPAEIKQLTWKDTVDVEFCPGGGHNWTAHFYKTRNRS